tara:strand:- start:99 stop:1562 length:1464 start_codon:yes stop_codon:yes gene_type:complete
MSIITKTIGVIFKVVLFLLCVSVLGIVGLNFVDINPYRADITKAITDASGIPLSIDGPLKIQLFPSPGVKAAQISTTIGPNKSKFKLSAESLELDYNIKMFFSDRMSLDAFNLKGVKIESLTDKQKQFEFEYLKGSVRFDDRGIHVDKIQTKHLLGTFSGSFQYLNGIPGSIVGHFTSPEIKIVGSAANKIKRQKLFSTDKIDLGLASQFKLDVDIDTDKLILGELILDNVALKLNTDKNSLKLTQSGTMSGGAMKTEANIKNIGTVSPNADVKINLNGANASEFLKQFNPALAVTGGTARMIFEGRGPISTIQNFMGHLNGSVLFDAKNILIKGQTKQSLSAGGAIFNILSLQGVSKRQEVVECAVVKLKVQNGIATANNSLAVESSSLLAIGRGEINFKNEALKLNMTFEPKNSLPFSIGDFDNLAVIGGTLRNPEVQLNSMGAIGEGVTLFLGIPTMGLSVLAKNLVDMAQIGGSPCQQAMSSK